MSAGMATAFAALLVLFIAQPSLPGKVHYALLSQSEIQQSDEKSSAPFAGNGEVLLASANQAAPLDVYPQHGSIHIEADREMVRLQAARELNREVATVEPIAPSEIYAINRFRMDDGREAVVYTQLSMTLASYRESY